MKTIIWAFILILITSFSAMAAETFQSMPKSALRLGTVPVGTYEFHKIIYQEEDGHQPRADKKVFVQVLKISQKKDPSYSQNVGQGGSENLGRATDIVTALQVRINDNGHEFACNLQSSGLSDGMGDAIGYDDAELRCFGENLLIKLIDYSENLRDTNYEIFVQQYNTGVFSNKTKSFTASIEAK